MHSSEQAVREVEARRPPPNATRRAQAALPGGGRTRCSFFLIPLPSRKGSRPLHSASRIGPSVHITILLILAEPLPFFHSQH
jgi:hypothetical protein